MAGRCRLCLGIDFGRLQNCLLPSCPLACFIGSPWFKYGCVEYPFCCVNVLVCPMGAMSGGPGPGPKGLRWKGSKGNLLGHYQNRTLLRVAALVECPALSMTNFGGRLHALMIRYFILYPRNSPDPGGWGGEGCLWGLRRKR